jgi:hypothetical protein
MSARRAGSEKFRDADFAIRINNIDPFAGMAGIEFHIEGPVGQFAIGSGMKPKGSGW